MPTYITCDICYTHIDGKNELSFSFDGNYRDYILCDLHFSQALVVVNKFIQLAKDEVISGRNKPKKKKLKKKK